MDDQERMLAPGEGLAMDDTYFTDQVRFVLQLARDESQRLGVRYIGPEHVLLAILKHGRNSGTDALEALHVDIEAIAESLERELRAGANGAGRDRDEAHAARHLLLLADHIASNIGPEAETDVVHLLLATLTFETALGVPLLLAGGATFEAVRDYICRS